METGIHSTGNIFAIIYYVLIFKTVKEKKYIMISIVVCSKNSELTIKETLNSIKKQSYKNLEIILVDGKSEDKTIKIFLSYKFKKKNY